MFDKIIFSITEYFSFDLSDLIAICALGIAIYTFRQTSKKELSDETQKVYDDWFTIDYSNKRKKYNEAMSRAIADAKLELGRSGDSEISRDELSTFLKKQSFSTYFKEDEKEAILHWIYYFDKIGWLCAAGLINKEFIIAPFHNWIVRVWQDNESFIKKFRDHDYIDGKSSWHHSKGLENLYEYCKRNSHSDLVDRFFTKDA